MTDPYHKIYDGEIHQLSRCIWHENTLMDFFRSQLMMRGYQTEDANKKVWIKGNQRVVICLVDDFTTCATIPAGVKYPYIPTLWQDDTIVITDNRVTCPTRFQVKTLPSSFFGIYAHCPEQRNWQPDRRFNFAINRIDHRRMALFLEYRKRLPWEPDRDEMDYVNFNCWRWGGDNSTAEGLSENFEKEYEDLDQCVKDMHQITKDTDIPDMPWRNHELGLEDSMHCAWINMVVETYSGEGVIALSEKIFRALTLPVPWQVYGPRYTVAYLEQLGFDCLSDTIQHSYDSIPELKTMDHGDKLVEWWWTGSENYAHLLEMDLDALKARAQQAARHNQQRLNVMQKNWAQDFAAWWNETSKQI